MRLKDSLTVPQRTAYHILKTKYRSALELVKSASDAAIEAIREREKTLMNVLYLLGQSMDTECLKICLRQYSPRYVGRDEDLIRTTIQKRQELEMMAESRSN